MKITVLQENLSKALSTCSRFTSTRAQLPVLGNILFSASKTKLKVSATNLETSIVVSLGAQIKEEGEITIPAKVATEIVTNLLPGSVELESSKEHLVIKSQGFNAKALGINPAEFPKIPQEIDSVNSIILPKELLLESLGQLLFAVSLDESRPVLTGILFIFSKEGLTLVATDGFRLSQKNIAFKNKGIQQKLVLPKNPLMEVAKLGAEAEEIKIVFKEKENQAVFGLDGTILSSRILEGKFPDYEKIIPQNSTLMLKADKEELLRAVKLASVFARDSANIVKFKVGSDSLNLSAESAQAGSQEMVVEAKVEGETPFEISFNYRFLEEFLRAIKGEEVQMKFTSSDAPGVFVDTLDPNFLHLIMPVKIQA